MSQAEKDQQALFEAAGWMARLSDGVPSDETRSEFKTWLTADSLHVRAMEAVESEWRLAGRLPAAAPQRRPRTAPLRFAAAFAALAVVAFFVIRPLYGEAAYDSGIGETRDVTLADGSRLHLDADSALDVSFDPFARQVVLKRGAAEFSVAHQRWRPFTVAAGAASIRVTGTHFLARREASGAASAYLIEGAIELRDPATGQLKAELRPGNGASISPAGAIAMQAGEGLKDKAWLSGKLLFDQTALSDAIEQFRHYGPVAVKLSGDDLSGLKISGLYNSRDLSGFLQSVATAYPLHLVPQPDGVLLIEKLPGKK